MTDPQANILICQPGDIGHVLRTIGTRRRHPQHTINVGAPIGCGVQFSVCRERCIFLSLRLVYVVPDYIAIMLREDTTNRRTEGCPQMRHSESICDGDKNDIYDSGVIWAGQVQKYPNYLKQTIPPLQNSARKHSHNLWCVTM